MTTKGSHSDALDAIFKKKQVLRTQLRKTLKAMDPSVRSQQDIAIQSIVLEAPWFRTRVVDKNRLMRMFHISCIDDFVTNFMEILEPASG